MRYRERSDLRARLRETGRNPADVARACGVSYAHVCGILAGRTCPSRRLALSLAYEIGVAPDDLLGAGDADSPARTTLAGT